MFSYDVRISNVTVKVGCGTLKAEKLACNILFPKHLKELRTVTDAIGVPVTIVGERILTRFLSVEYEEVFRNY
ncbi:MAG: hypothetical protein WA125_09765 [Desulfosporosinus sp.]